MFCIECRSSFFFKYPINNRFLLEQFKFAPSNIRYIAMKMDIIGRNKLNATSVLAYTRFVFYILAANMKNNSIF